VYYPKLSVYPANELMKDWPTSIIKRQAVRATKQKWDKTKDNSCTKYKLQRKNKSNKITIRHCDKAKLHRFQQEFVDVVTGSSNHGRVD